MITTVTLNPCVDKTITVYDFKVESTNRVIKKREDISGKGINTSVSLKQLGYDTTCMGINFAENGELLNQFLAGLRVPHEFVMGNGSLRTNIKIFDEKRRTMTELNEPGSSVTAEMLEVLCQKIPDAAAKSEILILSGSLPRGVPADFYARIIEAIKDLGVKIIVDTYGEPLRKVISNRVFLIKPNLQELEETFAQKVTSTAELIRVCRRIIAAGVRYICVSLGKNGAVLVSEDASWYCAAPDVSVKGIQGAGDSMVAGICIAILKGLPMGPMLQYGTAVCGGSLQLEGTQMCRQKDFDAMLTQVRPAMIDETQALSHFDHDIGF